MFWLLLQGLNTSTITSISNALCMSPHLLISPAGVDYEAVTTTLMFNDSMSAQVVTIPILDDLIVENYCNFVKSFGVTLTTIDTAVTLRSQTASVTIRDDDSKLHCCLGVA